MKTILILSITGLCLAACASTNTTLTIAQQLKIKCETGEYDSCNDLGYLNEYGISLAINKQKAFDLYQQACNGNSAAGCNNLGRFYAFSTDHIININNQRAIDLFKKACQLGERPACSNLYMLNIQHSIKQ